MKFLVKMLLLALLLYSAPANSANLYFANQLSIGKKINHIVLRGRLFPVKSRPRSAENIPPVKAEIDEDNLMFEFLDIGIITLVIRDSFGEDVYRETINTDIYGTLSIARARFSSGHYLINIEDLSGGFMYGEFLID